MDNFLPSTAPPGANACRIDFTKTEPPLPQYRYHFAAIIDNILTESECTELIRIAESSTVSLPSETPTWERAMLNVGGGEQVLAPDTRNCGRIIYDTPELAQKLLDRLRPFLQELGLETIDKQWRVTRQPGERYELTRLNERLRFLRYEGGEFFRPHWDGWYTTPDRTETSYYTIHLYLNGDGAQDLQALRRASDRVGRMDRSTGTVNLDPNGKLLGGATSFIRGFVVPNEAVRVFPKAGSVLVFQQNGMLHGGDPVYSGVKYTLRTDIMYRQV
ncbi:hypothetical protein BBP40_002326 [Aspergillus hancockii]|nr:hypothetical protein BBP40_002326 [Aspergillus hancockii]